MLVAVLSLAACGHGADPVDDQAQTPRVIAKPAEAMASIAAGRDRVSELECLPGEVGTLELGAREYVQAIHYEWQAAVRGPRAIGSPAATSRACRRRTP